MISVLIITIEGTYAARGQYCSTSVRVYTAYMLVCMLYMRIYRVIVWGRPMRSVARARMYGRIVYCVQCSQATYDLMIRLCAA